MDLSRKKVLVVENNAHMRRVFSEILTAFEVGTILEASDALGAFLLLASEEIDLVILDFFLDSSDGTELLTLVRNDPASPNAATPVLIVTALPQHDRVRSAIRQGVCAVMAKPIEPRALYRHIAEALQDPQQSRQWTEKLLAGAA